MTVRSIGKVGIVSTVSTDASEGTTGSLVIQKARYYSNCRYVVSIVGRVDTAV